LLYWIEIIEKCSFKQMEKKPNQHHSLLFESEQSNQQSR
jgi:hypothetical protein